MKDNYKHDRLFRITLGLTFFILINAGSISGQEHTPTVKVSFEIPASVFPDYDSQVRESIITEINSDLAEKCSTYFSFLHWTTISQISSVSDYDYRLILKLTVSLLQNGLTNFDLEYIGKIDTNYFEIYRFLKPYRLYNYYEDIPVQQPAKLKEDIMTAMEKQFIEDEFRLKLHENFLKVIPISQNALADSEKQRLILPIEWSDLKATEESVLRVEFESDQIRGIIKMNPEVPITTDSLKGQSQCVIIFFSYEPINVSTWHNEIAKRLSRSHLNYLNVYMIKYDRDINPGTYNAIVTDPD